VADLTNLLQVVNLTQLANEHRLTSAEDRLAATEDLAPASSSLVSTVLALQAANSSVQPMLKTHEVQIQQLQVANVSTQAAAFALSTRLSTDESVYLANETLTRGLQQCRADAAAALDALAADLSAANSSLWQSLQQESAAAAATTAEVQQQLQTVNSTLTSRYLLLAGSVQQGYNASLAAPLFVLASPGDLSASVEWGSAQYTVTSSPGGLTCSSVDTSCTVS